MPIKSKNRKKPLAVALDLGSTRLKLALLADDGELYDIRTVPAPRLTGDGLIREGNPDDYLCAATRLLEQLPAEASAVPLGLVCQRSSFTIWDKSSGQALIPMVSWQDRRAADWCDEHPDLDGLVQKHAGLRLSPHFMGPKLAAMQADNPALGTQLSSGEFLVGNLDAWLIWNWTSGRVHQTDLSMGARTALLDIEEGDWSDPLLEIFKVPRAALPDVVPTRCGDLLLDRGLSLSTSIADQASSAVAVLDPDDDVALVNFGTGAFVLRPTDDPGIRKPGYLTAPVLGGANSDGVRFVLEGTINGAGSALDQFGPGPTDLPAVDRCPDGFAVPDIAGLGSPHWRADHGLTLSDAAGSLSPLDQRRCVLEGLLFRVTEILTDLGEDHLPRHVLVSGGLAQDPGIAAGLASLTGSLVTVLGEQETSLLGAARLAAGLAAFANLESSAIERTDAGAYLPEKFLHWKNWLQDLLDAGVNSKSR
jgi:glycerol kinase